MGYPMTSFARGGGLWVNHIQGGGTIAAYELVYLDATGRWQPADADAVATMPVVGLSVEPLSVGQYGRVLLQGFATNNVWTWNPGAALYPTSATGALSETAGVIAQVVAFAHAATSIYFDPKGFGLGVATGCPILEGATAYVGDDACKSPFTNYFYTGDFANHTLLLAAVVDYVATLGGGSISLEAMTFDGRLIIDETEVLVFGQGWDTVIQQTADAGHAIVVSGVRCGVRDLHCLTEAGGQNAYDAINITGEDCIVDNVFVSESDQHAILLNAPRGRITNCYLFNIDDNGVSIGALGDSSNVSNNIINTTGADGILIDAAGENCVVEGNFITTWTGEAIDDNSGTASIGDDNWAGAGSYETQAGIIAVPTVTAGGAWQGRTIEVYNSTEERYFSWTYNDGGFRGVELL